jgi:hypothetical protein
MSVFGFEESKIMTIQQVVDDLKNALNDYATATQTGDLDNVKRLRGVIQNKIKSYQPENTEEGIFDDIISLLPEQTFNQFIEIQKNILNENDNNIVPIDPLDKNFIDKLAKNFLLGKAGFNLIYKNTQNNLNTMAGSFIDKVAYVTSQIPELPLHKFDDDKLLKLVDESKQNISAASSGIAADCKKAIDTNVKSFFSFIDIIKNTVDQLLKLTPTEYEHPIWGDRRLYVNEDGTLVDPVEQIRLNMIIDELKKSCGRQNTQPLPYEKLEKDFYKTNFKRQISAPVLLPGVLKTKYDSETEEDEDSQELDYLPSYSSSQDSDGYESDEIPSALVKRGQQQIGPLYKKPNINTGGKTKKNKRKSKNVKRKSKKVKRKSGRKTYKNKRNRRNKRKTRVKK